MNRSFRQHFSIISVLALSGCLLGACNNDKKPTTQAVANVDGVDISIYQVNDAVASVPGVTSANVAQVRREVLKRLVDQQLAVEKAQASSLDRSVAVIQGIEAAKREILARAYLDKIKSAIFKTTDIEAKKYFQEMPQLFAERRVFSVQEIIVPIGALPETALNDVIANKSMTEIAKSLSDKKIKLTANTYTKAAEQFPLALLPMIHAMKDGQTRLLPLKDTISIVHLVASQTVPATEVAALPRIRQFLDNQKASAAIDAELKNLREKAKIEYIAAADNPDELKPATNGQTATADKKPSDKTPAANVEKGVAGLK